MTLSVPSWRDAEAHLRVLKRLNSTMSDEILFNCDRTYPTFRVEVMGIIRFFTNNLRRKRTLLVELIQWS